jgi:hypothetical protein
MELFTLAAATLNAKIHAAPLLRPPAPATNSLWSAAPLSAFIGAGSALTVMLIKDGLLDWLKTRRAHKLSDAEIFQRYLGPLGEACGKLMWRSKEIFVDDRNAFLKLSTLPANFNAYKRLSTLYRIASLIGWIRGMDLELSSHAAHNPGYVAPIAKQIAAFCSALADGPDVERDRLLQLCKTWSLDLTGISEKTLAKVGIRVEVKFHSLIAAQINDVETMSVERAPGTERLVSELAKFIADELGLPRPDMKAAIASTAEVMESLAYREALIYREWQDAIGDAMIERDRDSPRKFRIIGFAAFSELMEKPEHIWFKVFATSLDDIDFENPDRRDFRAHQLRKIANAVGAILVAIDKTAAKSPLSKDTVTAAIKLIEATQ